jgi:DNA polymerase-3 subunit alpha
LTLDDPEVYELFSKAQTDGVFQFESGGMKDILRRLKPERFEDLVALNALYRPGPLGGGLVDDFIKRRHGKVKVQYPHPLLEDILRETYGVIVYQEQVMQIASVMGGYSLGDADILRRAMGKKKKEVMDAEEQKFVERAKAKGIDPGKAKKVFELMAYFAGYGFNKSHSAAYALVAYHTAWLKRHHPVHFMAALLTNDKGNTDKLVQYIGEAREMQIDVLPPDVNVSGLDFTVDGGQVRFGLSAIKNVGESAIRSMLEAREGAGRFESMHDLCSDVDSRLVNKRVLEALVQSGAADSLGGRRSQLAAVIDSALELGQKRRADREAGQSSLFGEDDVESAPPKLPDLPEWDEATRLSHEKASLGFYVSGHPLDSYKDVLASFETQATPELREGASGRQVAVAGVPTGLRRRKSKNGDWWASLHLEDLQGQVEVLVFPKTYATCEKQLEEDTAVMVHGRIENEDQLRLIAEEVCPLDQLLERQADAVEVKVDANRLDAELVEALKGALGDHRGEATVFFDVARSGSYRMVMKAGSFCGVTPSRRLTERIEGVVGQGSVRYRPRKRQPRERPRRGGRQVRT